MVLATYVYAQLYVDTLQTWCLLIPIGFQTRVNWHFIIGEYKVDGYMYSLGNLHVRHHIIRLTVL